MPPGTQTIARLPVADVLPTIGDDAVTVFHVNGLPVSINTHSVRLQCFKANTACVACGVEGAYFGVDLFIGQPRPHLNLYTADGQLMTRDHIVPKSKGGRDDLTNAQTMCSRCNALKGCSLSA